MDNQQTCSQIYTTNYTSVKKRAWSARKRKAGSLAHTRDDDWLIKRKRSGLLDGPISLTIRPSLPRGAATVFFSFSFHAPCIFFNWVRQQQGVIEDILEQINLGATNCPRCSLLPQMNPTHTNTSLSLNPIWAVPAPIFPHAKSQSKQPKLQSPPSASLSHSPSNQCLGHPLSRPQKQTNILPLAYAKHQNIHTIQLIFLYWFGPIEASSQLLFSWHLLLANQQTWSVALIHAERIKMSKRESELG